MDYNDNEVSLLWLALAQNVNIYDKCQLYREFDDITELYNNFASHRDIVIHHIKVSGYNKLAELRDDDSLARYMLAMEENNIYFLSIDHDDYPARLRNIDDPPIGLFYRGDVSLLSANNTLAVVGSRYPTRYGKDITRKLTSDVAGHKVVIVSGLARGVDSVAHKACLDNYGRTIAILGNGIDVIYPAENKDLYEQIAASGIIISEYPMQVKPLQYNFPPRNRIISALSDGVLITEASKKSGTMITVNYAIDHGKEIFSVPGPIFAESSEGTNYLLTLPGTVIVRSSEDILYKYDVIVKNSEPSVLQLDFTSQMIVDEVKNEPKHFDELLAKTELNVSELQTLLITLELQGIIAKHSGNCYGKAL